MVEIVEPERRQRLRLLMEVDDVVGTEGVGVLGERIMLVYVPFWRGYLGIVFLGVWNQR